MTRNADGENSPDTISVRDFYDLKRQVGILQSEVERLTGSYGTIINKLDSLPREIVLQIREMIEREFEMHTARCPVPETIKKELQAQKEADEKKEAGKEVGFQNWVIKNLLSILAMLVATIAAYFGIK